jgi:DNA-binding SARP family transcriptional activator/tetratricopeptide (TPR) repeat protein
MTRPVKLTSSLELNLLGAGEARLGGERLELPTRKGLALLAYLALEGATSRSRLSGLLWSDNDEESARRNLRRELHRLRQSGLRDHFESEGDTIALNGAVTTDVASLHTLETDASESELEAALQGQAQLLEGHALDGAPLFADWRERERLRVAAARRRIALVLAERLETRGEWRGALALHLRLLHEDSLQERQHREVMRLHYLLGEREAALEQFRRCRDALHLELGLEPLPETVLLAERIRQAQTLERVETQVRDAGVDLRAPLVGRDAALAALERQVGATLLVGEPGVGKTRLAQEFASSHSGLTLRFTEASRQTPLAGVAEVLRANLKHPALTRLDPVWRSELARLVPEFEPEAPPRTSSAEGRVRFLEGLTRSLFALGQTIVLDDLHWADTLSLEFVAHLIPRAETQGVRLIATARDQELSDSPPAFEVIAALERDGHVRRLEVRPLTADDVLTLVRSMSGSLGGRLFAQRLSHTTAGNPYFILETLRHLFETGSLQVDASGIWRTPFDETTSDYTELTVPESVTRAIFERLERLGASSLRLLQTAALAGSEFSFGEVQPATALGEWESLDGLERAVNASILERSDSRYRFAHDLVRTALELNLSLERRLLIHAKLAASLQQSQAAPSRVAHHFEQSGKRLEAVEWRVKAAREAERIYAHREALAQYQCALDHEPPLRIAFQLRAERIALWQTLDEPTELLGELEQLKRLAGQIAEPDIWIEAQLIEAQMHQERGESGKALQLSDTLLKRHDLQPEQRVRAIYQAAVAALSLAQLAPADERLTRGLKAEMSAKWRGKYLIARCQIQVRLGQLEAAAHLADAALLAFRMAGDRAGEIEALQGAGIVNMATGQLEAAARYFQTALELARAIGEQRFQRNALMNLTAIHLNLGKLQAVQQNLDGLLEMPAETLDPIVQARVHYYFGHYHRLVGQLGQALEHRLEHRRLLHQLDSPHEQIMAGLGVAVSLLDCGDLEAALALLDDLELIATEHDLSGLVLELRLTRIEGQLSGASPPTPDSISTMLRDSPVNDPELQTQARILLARAHGRHGEPERGLSLLGHEEVHPRLRVSHLNTRLTLLARLQHEDERVLSTARRLLKQDTTPPLERFSLRRALLAWLEATAQTRAALRVRHTLQEQRLALAATLEQYPELKTRFLSQPP